ALDLHPHRRAGGRRRAGRAARVARHQPLPGRRAGARQLLAGRRAAGHPRVRLRAAADRVPGADRHHPHRRRHGRCGRDRPRGRPGAVVLAERLARGDACRRERQRHGGGELLMRRAPIAAGALAAAALAAACGGGPEVLVPDTTVVLDQATLGALEEVSEDRATFRFARSTALLDELEVGGIIVADVFAPHLPAGALRRVRSIERSAGVVVTTDPASLAEAIERGSIRERIDLREEGMRSLRVLPGVRPDISATGLYFGLNDVVLFDGDGDPDTDDRVVMNGNIAIEPSLDLVIEIDGFSLEEASIAIVGEVSGNVNIDARREATLPGEPIKLASIGLGTYTFFVGPVPVVIGSYVDLEVG